MPEKMIYGTINKALEDLIYALPDWQESPSGELRVWYVKDQSNGTTYRVCKDMDGEIESIEPLGQQLKYERSFRNEEENV